jgi:hypothetical protein
MDPLHADLAQRSGKQPAVWLLEDTEADRRTRGRRHRRRRRLTRTTRAHAPQAIHEWGGRR